jgi:hypothetical protein
MNYTKDEKISDVDRQSRRKPRIIKTIISDIHIVEKEDKKKWIENIRVKK